MGAAWRAARWSARLTVPDRTDSPNQPRSCAATLPCERQLSVEQHNQRDRMVPSCVLAAPNASQVCGAWRPCTRWYTRGIGRRGRRSDARGGARPGDFLAP